MANLAVQADVEASLLRALTTNEALYVDTLLARASRTVRAYTGQYIEEVTDETITVNADLYGNLRLPQIPVTDVSSLTVAGTELDPADYQWEVHGHITQPSFNSWEINGAIAVWTGQATAIYTHGYPTIPDDIVEIVADLVAGRLSSTGTASGAVKRAEVDDVTVEYDTTAATTIDPKLTDDQKRVLDKYKQPARPINMLTSRVPWR